MRICGLQKLSLLDYPEKLAATVFLGGCNFRCPFCHNASLVLRPEECPEITRAELTEFLIKRKGKLDGVCITGGEPLLNGDIAELIDEIRSLGYLVKLDTNGSRPKLLRELIDSGRVDYVAMDIKNSPKKYPSTVGLASLDMESIYESVRILMERKVPYEFRTTVYCEAHTEDDMEKIGEWLQGADKLYLQAFVDSGDLVSGGASTLSKAETERFRDILAHYIVYVGVRGL